MRPKRIRLTVFRMLLAVAAVALLLQVVSNPMRERARAHRDRCLDIAGGYSRTAAEYRKNAAGSPSMLRIARWLESLSREFTTAAIHPELGLPEKPPFPPDDWPEREGGEGEPGQ